MDEAAWREHEKIQERYWWHRHKREVLLSIAEERPYSRVLEIGAGGGSMAASLQKPCRRVTTDLDLRHVSPGGAVARLPELCFKPGLFDLVILSEVLEHLDAPVEALKTVHRVMAPGGRCLITVPAWPMLWSEHDRFYGHKKRYTPAILRSELNAAGFEVSRTGWMFFAPFWPVLVWRLAKRPLETFRNSQPPQSDFVPMPELVNTLCYFYLHVLEYPLAARGWLPIGSTLSAVAVKPVPASPDNAYAHGSYAEPA